MNKLTFFLIFGLLLATSVHAEEDEDWQLFGVEAEKLFNLGSGILATILLGLTFAAYLRTKQNRLLYVSLAFFLFAIKGYLTSMELFFGEWLWVDPTAAILNFAILLSFFQGIIKSR